MEAEKAKKQVLDRERYQILRQWSRWMEMPMLVLGFVWLLLLVAELIWGLNRVLQTVSIVIWVLFILDFIVKFVLAPKKRRYLKRNLLTAASLLIPAIRVFRVVYFVRFFRLARATRSLHLVRLLTSVNRGMKSLGATMRRRGMRYVIALTVLVLFSGAAGMYAFESRVPEGFASYGEALWWTAMLLTTIASEYWPQTTEGRILCFVLSLYSLGILGYVTAALATFFIGQDADNDETELAGTKAIEGLHAEIVALRAELAARRGPE